MSKKIIITGAGGFVGGYLTTHFLTMGWNVVAVFHKESNETIEQAKKRTLQQQELMARIVTDQFVASQPKIFFYDADICDQEAMRELFNLYDSKFDAIIHTAAMLVPPDEKNYADHSQFMTVVEKFIEVNQAHVLADCVAEYKAKNDSFYSLLISSIFVFKNQEEIDENTEHKCNLTELDLLEHCDKLSALIKNNLLYPYSKDEAQQYWESKGLNPGVIFPPQIGGSRQYTPAIIPRITRNLLSISKEPTISIGGEINLIHVQNLCEAIYHLCSQAVTGSFCINGDGPLSLPFIAESLTQKAIELYGDGKVNKDAWKINPNPAGKPLSINESKLQNRFPTSSLHPLKLFDHPHEDAKEMVESCKQHHEQMQLV